MKRIISALFGLSLLGFIGYSNLTATPVPLINEVPIIISTVAPVSTVQKKQQIYLTHIQGPMAGELRRLTPIDPRPIRTVLPFVTSPPPSTSKPVAQLSLEPPTPLITVPLRTDETIPKLWLGVSTNSPTNKPYDIGWKPDFEMISISQRMAEIAENSPVQPDSRHCRALSQSRKVRSSLGVDRQITERASLGVAYVYKDGCYQDAITSIRRLDMPSDDGVNVRLKVTF